MGIERDNRYEGEKSQLHGDARGWLGQVQVRMRSQRPASSRVRFSLGMPCILHTVVSNLEGWVSPQAVVPNGADCNPSYRAGNLACRRLICRAVHWDRFIRDHNSHILSNRFANRVYLPVSSSEELSTMSREGDVNVFAGSFQKQRC